jgi:hypothetical protein
MYENGERSMLIDINGDGLLDRVFGENPETNQKGFFVYSKPYKTPRLKGLWSNTRSGKPSPLMSINIERSPFSCVGRFFQFSSPPKLLCHCLPEPKPSPVLR